MIKNIPIEKVLFIDIETVPQVEDFSKLSETEQKLWDKKTARQREEDISAEDFYRDKAGIMAEFGKIICISIGIYDKNNKILIRSFAGDNEEELLKEFGEKALEYYRRMGEGSELQQKYAEQKKEVEDLIASQP